MGEISEMITEGILCRECGQYIDDDDDPRTCGADGYPRFCADCGGDPNTNYAAKKQKPKRWLCNVCQRKFSSIQGLTDHKRDKHEAIATTGVNPNK